MNIDTEKLRVIEQLMQVDDATLLEEVKELLTKRTVGYHPDGRCIMQEEFIQRAKTSDEAIERGEVISLNDLEEEANGW